MKSRILSLIIAIFILVPSVYAVDFYVATNGINNPENGTEESPFRSISYALSVADTTDGAPHTIYIGNGRYSDIEVFPLPIIDNISLVGEDRENTILDASNSITSVIAAVDVTNWSIKNLTITGGYEIQGGGILATLGSDVLLKNLIITENRADYSIAPGSQGEGGGLFLYECDNVVVENVLFSLNSAVTHGGAIMVTRCSPVFDNVSIHHNSCFDEPASSAIFSDGIPNDEVIVKNSIIWGNPGGYGEMLSITGDVDVHFSLVENTESSPFPGTGNRWFVEPLFVDFENNDYRVLEGSWTVDAGDLSSDYENEPEPNGGVVNLGYLGNTEETVISGAQYELRRDRWAFIGIPVDSDVTSPATLFGDDLNNASNGADTWRFMRWNSLLEIFLRFGEPEADGVERGNPPAVEPGLGFLMRQSMFNRRNVDAPGFALTQSETFQYSLQSDGDFFINMMANPFPYSINHSGFTFNANSTNYTFDEAAQAGYMNRWMYTLDSDGHFIPDIGVLDPWQGAIMITTGDESVTWLVEPERNEPVYGDPLAELDWGLYLSVVATDSNGSPLAYDNNHIFGVGENSDYISDGVDPYDAYSLDLLTTPLTFHWELEDGTALYHDMRKVDDEYYPMWHGVVTGSYAAMDSVLIQIDGINNDTSEVYPSFDYGFELRGDSFPHEILIDNLRDSTTFKLPFETLGDGSKFLSFYIYATHPDWIENDVDDEPQTIPGDFRIESVYPNPFNASTSVVFSMFKQGNVDLKVFDVLGREVDRQSLKALSAGRHRLNWTPTNVASGVYFMQLQSAGITEVKKVVLVR